MANNDDAEWNQLIMDISLQIETLLDCKYLAMALGAGGKLVTRLNDRNADQRLIALEVVKSWRRSNYDTATRRGLYEVLAKSKCESLKDIADSEIFAGQLLWNTSILEFFVSD